MSNVIGGYRFSEQDFEDLFIEFYLVNGYTPIASELGKNGLPTTATIRRRFNLTYNISESIVANWLYDNGIDYEPHVPYHRELIADFKAGEYFIEFFGLHHDEEYMRKVKLKQRLCEKKGYKLISLFQDDLSKLDEKLEVLINDSEEATK